MAGLEGLEPTTVGFGDRCSSQLELQTCLIVVPCLGFEPRMRLLSPDYKSGPLAN